MGNGAMSEMVVRVAGAIADIDFLLPGAGGLRGKLKLAPAQSLEIARVAIEAMREPTEDMVKYVDGHPDHLGYGDDGFDWIWSTMIDAALKSK